MSGISVVIPVYNEVNEIKKVIDKLRDTFSRAGLDHEFIVVDDASIDGSGAVLDGIEGIILLRNSANSGYGASLKNGIRRSSYDVIAIADADNTYPVEDIPGLLGQMESGDNDMVVGERKNIVYPRFNWLKQRGRNVIDLLCSYLAGAWIPDINSGLRLFKRAKMKEFESELCDRFSFTTSLTLLFFFKGYKVSYFPVDYCLEPTERKTKVRIWKDGWRTLLLIFSLGLRHAAARTAVLLLAPLALIAVLIILI